MRIWPFFLDKKDPHSAPIKIPVKQLGLRTGTIVIVRVSPFKASRIAFWIHIGKSYIFTCTTAYTASINLLKQYQVMHRRNAS